MKYYFSSKIGWFEVMYGNDKIFSIQLINKFKGYKQIIFPEIQLIESLISKYLEGENVDFSPVKLDFSYLSEFQKKVYTELQKVPFGSTISYKSLGKNINCNSPRAIGSAMANNPFLIVVPCHRVIKENGEIGQYSGLGGREAKEKLLNLEKMNCKTISMSL